MNNQKNVFGTHIQPSFSENRLHTRWLLYLSPMTGTTISYYNHEFLEFSKQAGNNLSDPVPQYNFPGLKAGDQWCLCLSRWIEAHQHNCAPRVILESTNESVLEKVSLDTLKEFEL